MVARIALLLIVRRHAIVLLVRVAIRSKVGRVLRLLLHLMLGLLVLSVIALRSRSACSVSSILGASGIGFWCACSSRLLGLLSLHGVLFVLVVEAQSSQRILSRLLSVHTGVVSRISTVLLLLLLLLRHLLLLSLRQSRRESRVSRSRIGSLGCIVPSASRYRLRSLCLLLSLLSREICCKLFAAETTKVLLLSLLRLLIVRRSTEQIAGVGLLWLVLRCLTLEARLLVES